MIFLTIYVLYIFVGQIKIKLFKNDLKMFNSLCRLSTSRRISLKRNSFGGQAGSNQPPNKRAPGERRRYGICIYELFSIWFALLVLQATEVFLYNLDGDLQPYLQRRIWTVVVKWKKKRERFAIFVICNFVTEWSIVWFISFSAVYLTVSKKRCIYD